MTTSNQLATKLMEAMPVIGHAMSRATRTANGPADMNGMIQLRTLHMLVNGPLTFKELCAHRGVAAPTLSRSINTMVKRGWVERTPHPRDGRQLMLKVTRSGRAHFDGLVTSAHGVLAESLKSLSPQERKSIFHALELLKSTLSQ
jgi:DNA-binding MarR family transcriptional regulator